MKKEQAIKKNLDLLNEFMKFAFEKPEVLERIPADAELIILPVDNPELYEYNQKTADKMLSQGKKVVIVKMKKPEIAIPELELKQASTY
jgi:hypothetical protein